MTIAHAIARFDTLYPNVFPYAENGTVHVQVRFPQAMRLAAIATVAHCHAPNMFEFRQWADDFLIAK